MVQDHFLKKVIFFCTWWTLLTHFGTHHWPMTAPNQKQAISWATWLKTRFRVHLIHMQPTFGGFWRILSSWWPVLALLKSQNALKLGCFATKNGSKMGQKCVFPKMILDHLGCLNK